MGEGSPPKKRSWAAFDGFVITKKLLEVAQFSFFFHALKRQGGSHVPLLCIGSFFVELEQGYDQGTGARADRALRLRCSCVPPCLGGLSPPSKRVLMRWFTASATSPVLATTRRERLPMKSGSAIATPPSTARPLLNLPPRRLSNTLRRALRNRIKPRRIVFGTRKRPLARPASRTAPPRARKPRAPGVRVVHRWAAAKARSRSTSGIVPCVHPPAPDLLL